MQQRQKNQIAKRSQRKRRKKKKLRDCQSREGTRADRSGSSLFALWSVMRRKDASGQWAKKMGNLGWTMDGGVGDWRVPRLRQPFKAKCEADDSERAKGWKGTERDRGARRLPKSCLPKSSQRWSIGTLEQVDGTWLTKHSHTGSRCQPHTALYVRCT